MQEMETENENRQVQSTNLSRGPPSSLWVLFNSLSFSGSLYIVIDMISGWIFDNYKIKHNVLNAMTGPIIAIFMPFLMLLHYRRRGTSYRLVGGNRRALIELSILGCAIILRIYCPFDGADYRKIGLLVLITFQLHCWGQSLHLCWDIYIGDVVVHALLQVGVYMTGYWTCIILTFIVSLVIWVRCVEYVEPITPEAIKKETA